MGKIVEIGAAWMMAALLATAGCAHAEGRLAENLAQIKLPPGFKIDVYAKVPKARSIAVDRSTGAVFVSTRGDKIYTIIDRNGDNVAEERTVLMPGLHVPNGIAFHDGVLYVGEQDRISKLTLATNKFGAPAVLISAPMKDGLPDRGHHGWRYLSIGPDAKLYVSLGAACNICLRPEPEGTIMRMNLDGSEAEIFARGVRNSVGHDFNPKTGEFFFTDNGGDGLGDTVPADEFNHAPKPGLHFGFPYMAGGRTESPEFSGQTPPMTLTPPVVEFGAHHAVLGMHFYRGDMFPEAYRGDAFVAQHGSWNRSEPAGYRVMRIRFDESGQPIGSEVFAEGWLTPTGDRWGRPVDVNELADGSLLVSDDHGGAVYRISYQR